MGEWRYLGGKRPKTGRGKPILLAFRDCLEGDGGRLNGWVRGIPIWEKLSDFLKDETARALCQVLQRAGEIVKCILRGGD